MQNVSILGTKESNTSRPPPPKTTDKHMIYCNKLIIFSNCYHPKNRKTFGVIVTVVNSSQVCSKAHPMVMIVISRHQIKGFVPTYISTIQSYFLFSFKQWSSRASFIPISSFLELVQLGNDYWLDFRINIFERRSSEILESIFRKILEILVHFRLKFYRRNRHRQKSSRTP